MSDGDTKKKCGFRARNFIYNGTHKSTIGSKIPIIKNINCENREIILYLKGNDGGINRNNIFIPDPSLFFLYFLVPKVQNLHNLLGPLDAAESEDHFKFSRSLNLESIVRITN